MMTVSKIPAAINENEPWRSLMVRADHWIREVLGEWAESKMWEWDVKTDLKGRPLFDLRLVFGETVVGERFDLFEISNQRLVSKRIVSAWGKLLDDESELRSRRFTDMVKQWKEEEVAVAN